MYKWWLKDSFWNKVIFLGFNLVGAWSNPIDIAPNFVGTIMGISGLFSYITGALVPHTYSLMANLVTSLNKDNVIHETEEKEHLVWTLLFVLVSVVCILTNFVFLILGTAERQTWNRYLLLFVKTFYSNKHF